MKTRAFCGKMIRKYTKRGKRMHTEKANAKINVYLNIHSRRNDGYHNIVSVMQTVSLCDLVTVDFQPAPKTQIALSISNNPELPTDCRNLAWRAAELFLQHTKQTGRVQITIDKQIPMAAGLAGGSADAAAVLRALNAICGHPFSSEELCKIGLTLGADVPFCIHGGTMLVTGIGERLQRIPDMPPCALVIAIGKEGVSTPQAYAALDEIYGFFEQPNTQNTDVQELIELWQKGDLPASFTNFFNIFEDVIAKEIDEIAIIKKMMREGGAMRSMMSGSGPSVFGVFDTLTEAEKTCQELQNKGFGAFVCSPCEQYLDKKTKK